MTWIKDGKTVALGDILSFDTNRNNSGQYWCLAENGLGLAINTSAYLDVQCKYGKKEYKMRNVWWCSVTKCGVSFLNISSVKLWQLVFHCVESTAQ